MAGYLAAKTGNRRGWQAALVEASGVKRQTITKWTNPKYDGYPDLDAIAQLAAGLGVRPWEVVAALDGDLAPVAVDPALEALIAERIEAVLDERLGPRAAAARQGPR